MKVSLNGSSYILIFTENRIYYQFKCVCLSACPLTLHALLHILNDISNNGPPCMNWTFVMECWCGLLLPVIKSCKRPFTSLALQQYQVAQYFEVINWHNLLDLMPTLIDNNVPSAKLCLVNRGFKVDQMSFWMSFQIIFWKSFRKLSRTWFGAFCPQMAPEWIFQIIFEFEWESAVLN